MKRIKALRLSWGGFQSMKIYIYLEVYILSAVETLLSHLHFARCNVKSHMTSLLRISISMYFFFDLVADLIFFFSLFLNIMKEKNTTNK